MQNLENKRNVDGMKNETVLINRQETSVRAVSRDSLTKRVADAIRAEVLNGNYKLGQRLQETELAMGFNVSNSVIREAFHILQGEGIVVTDAYRARYVFSISEPEYHDMTVGRASLESLAAYLAATRLEQQWESEISRAAARFRSARPSNYVEWVGMELDFHRAIWGAAHSSLLLKQLNQLTVPLFSLSTLHFKSRFGFEEILEMSHTWETTDDPQGHHRVAQAVLGGNPDVARKSMILHVMADSSLENLRKQFFQI